MRACVRAVWMPSEIKAKTSGPGLGLGVQAGTFPFPFSPGGNRSEIYQKSIEIERKSIGNNKKSKGNLPGIVRESIGNL